MIRGGVWTRAGGTGLPRMRGDDPVNDITDGSGCSFAPHARG